MPVDPNRVETIFHAALALPAADRGAFLAVECGADAELHARVERLLAAHDELGASADAPDAGPRTEDHTPQPDVGTLLGGKYKLLEEIGEGGMGTVWMAQQTEPVKRVVAVKLIKAGMDSRAVLARFEAERQALALMDHPNIAKVLDAGAAPDGRPFFVMELVKGVPITQYCDERKLNPRQRLELFVPVCNAIQHAHQKGVIHRDIKPSNVLIALYDDKPVPKVIDFGVAKAAGQPLTEKTLATGFGAVVGTPEYMSPEQASFNNLDIDTRSDVYALGVLLYELLAGSPPFSRKDLEKIGLLEIFRVIREQEPPRPSTKLSTADALPSLSANRGTEPKALTRLLRGELDWIVMKALEKDRNRRYETANGFAADVQRYLAGEPVQAVPPSAGYRLRKFLKRNKGRVVVSVLLLLALMFGVAGTTWQMAERRRERDVAAARSRQVVESALDQAEAALRAEKLAEVDAALAVAEQGLAQADAPDLRERIAAIKKDRAMITRLNDIFEQNWSISVGTMADDDETRTARFARRYKDTFAEYGFTVGEDRTAQMSERLRQSPIRDPLLTALGEWYSLDPKQPGLRALLDSGDPDTFRCTVRAAVLNGEWERLETLSAGVDGATLPPGFAVTLAQYGGHKNRLRILKGAWLAHPSYYPFPMQIGSYLVRNDKGVEAIPWFRLALALRPNSPSAHLNLFYSIACNAGFMRVGDEIDQQLREESESILRRIIQMRLDDAATHTWLGMVLFFHKRDVVGAQIAFKKALTIDPTLNAARVGLVAMITKRRDWSALSNMLEELNWSQQQRYEGAEYHYRLDNIASILDVVLDFELFPSLLTVGRPNLALRYYTKTHTDRAEGTPDPKSRLNSDRYHAACAAALAGTGQGSDAPPPGERPAVRRKGLEWLSADLKQWDRCATAAPAANRTAAHDAMNDWLAESYLKAVRDEAELAKLPPDEQAAWRTLWADVRALRDRTATAIAPPPREVKR